MSVVRSARASDILQPVNKQIASSALSLGDCRPFWNNRLNSTCDKIFPCPLPLTFICPIYQTYYTIHGYRVMEALTLEESLPFESISVPITFAKLPCRDLPTTA